MYNALSFIFIKIWNKIFCEVPTLPWMHHNTRRSTTLQSNFIHSFYMSAADSTRHSFIHCELYSSTLGKKRKEKMICHTDFMKHTPPHHYNGYQLSFSNITHNNIKFKIFTLKLIQFSYSCWQEFTAIFPLLFLL